MSLAMLRPKISSAYPKLICFGHPRGRSVLDKPTARLDIPMNEWRVLDGGMCQGVSDEFGDAVDFKLLHGPAAVCINGHCSGP